MKSDQKNADTLFGTSGEPGRRESVLHDGIREELRFLIQDATAAVNGEKCHGSLPEWAQTLRSIWLDLLNEGLHVPLSAVVVNFESAAWGRPIPLSPVERRRLILEVLDFAGGLLGRLQSSMPQGEPEELQRACEGDSTTPNSDEARAILLIHENPGRSVASIADELGVHRSTLYRMPTFKRALEMSKGPQRTVPFGSKSASGDLEACRTNVVACDTRKNSDT
jgi:hypothetical protein